jgi:hypothetical protein
MGKQINRLIFLWGYSSVFTLLLAVTVGDLFNFKFSIVDFISVIFGFFAFGWTLMDAMDKDKESDSEKKGDSKS